MINLGQLKEIKDLRQVWPHEALDFTPWLAEEDNLALLADYLSKVFDFNKADIMQTLSNTGRSLDIFNGFLHRPDDLRHSYEKFRFTGDVNKPPFDEVYHSVKAYIKDVLPREKKRELER